MLIVVPARAGSKGIPGKNFREFRGFPLVCWSFAAANALSKMLGAKMVCSTDDYRVKDLALSFGISVHDRRPELANDTAGMAGVVADVCGAFGQDQYILLQPTSPLRLTSDVQSFAKLVQHHETVVSCTVPRDDVEDIVDRSGEPVVTVPKTQTRQQRSDAFRFIDGTFYSGLVSNLTKGLGFTPNGTSFLTLDILAAVDIDTPFDWAMAEAHHDFLKTSGVGFVKPEV